MFAITTTHPLDGHTALRFATEDSAHQAVDFLNACADRHAYYRGRVSEIHTEGSFEVAPGKSPMESARAAAIAYYEAMLPHRMVVDVKALILTAPGYFKCYVMAGWRVHDEMPLLGDLAAAQAAQMEMR